MAPRLEWFPAASITEAPSEEYDTLIAEVESGKLVAATVYLPKGRGLETKDLFFPADVDAVIVAAGAAKYMGSLGIQLHNEKDAPPSGCRIRVDEQIEALRTYGISE